MGRDGVVEGERVVGVVTDAVPEPTDRLELGVAPLRIDGALPRPSRGTRQLRCRFGRWALASGRGTEAPRIEQISADRERRKGSERSRNDGQRSGRRCGRTAARGLALECGQRLVADDRSRVGDRAVIQNRAAGVAQSRVGERIGPRDRPRRPDRWAPRADRAGPRKAALRTRADLTRRRASPTNLRSCQSRGDRPHPAEVPSDRRSGPPAPRPAHDQPRPTRLQRRRRDLQAIRSAATVAAIRPACGKESADPAQAAPPRASRPSATFARRACHVPAGVPVSTRRRRDRRGVWRRRRRSRLPHRQTYFVRSAGPKPKSESGARPAATIR